MPEGNSDIAPGAGPGASISPPIPGSSSASVSTAIAPPPESKFNFEEHVPPDYKSKEWVGNILKTEKPVDELFKKVDNLQQALGKRLEVPGPDATPEVKKAFYKAIGVPDSPDGYGYQPPDISKESETVQQALLQRASDKDFIAALQKKALDVGIPKEAFNALAAEFDNLTIQQIRGAVERQTAKQAEFKAQSDTKFKEAFGDQAEYVERVSKEVFGKVLPENIRATNDPRVIIAALGKHIHEKLYANDKINTSASATSTPGVSRDQIHAKIHELRQKPEFKNWQHPGHKAIKAEVDRLYEEMVSIGKPQ